MITIELRHPELYDIFLSDLQCGRMSKPVNIARYHMSDQISWMKQRNIKFSIDAIAFPRDKTFIVTFTFENSADATLFKIKWC